MTDFAIKDIPNYIIDEPMQKEVVDSLKSFPAHAFEYDLNDDGINEVIGLPPPISLYMGPRGGSFFILQKQGEEYASIKSNMIYTYEDKIVILKEKTNGYHHMQFRRSGYPEPKHLIKYDKDHFRFYFYKRLEKQGNLGVMQFLGF